MYFRNAYHISYCTNIHPGQNWSSTMNSLRDYVTRIKQKVSPEGAFGIGLRLSNIASEELSKGENLKEFKRWLNNNHLYVFTMNGFPYGNFHNEAVKEMVHNPDWTTEDRLLYTKRLFKQLSYLLPRDVSGGISTSPISYKHWHSTSTTRDQVYRMAAANYVEIIDFLYRLEKDTGKYMHLDIEPEPDGMLENSKDVIRFYKNYLEPAALSVLHKRHKLGQSNVKDLIYRYITICYDICHFSLAYEEPEETFKSLEKAGIAIGKIQVSAALKILYDSAAKEDIWDSLSGFNEPTYLHQVTEKVGGIVKTYKDLPEVLKAKKEFTEMRAHFHVPIFLERFGNLFSTQDHILKVLSCLKENQITQHLEIETYTWEVLPPELKKSLLESIVREFKWLLSNL